MFTVQDVFSPFHVQIYLAHMPIWRSSMYVFCKFQIWNLMQIKFQNRRARLVCFFLQNCIMYYVMIHNISVKDLCHIILNLNFFADREMMTTATPTIIPPRLKIFLLMLASPRRTSRVCSTGIIPTSPTRNGAFGSIGNAGRQNAPAAWSKVLTTRWMTPSFHRNIPAPDPQSREYLKIWKFTQDLATL